MFHAVNISWTTIHLSQFCLFRISSKFWLLYFFYLGQQPPAPAEPPKPVPKAPIPAEHQVLQEIFEKLAKKCLESANNPVSMNGIFRSILIAT